MPRFATRNCTFFQFIIVILFTYGTCVAPATAQSNEPKDIQDHKLETKDGVQLGITYYRSKMGKKAVPIVMLHNQKESRAVFDELARVLQNPEEEKYDSHAVITVDMRGHGESTTAIDFSGEKRTIEPSRLNKRDYRDMVLFDMEAVRKFLVSKNDAGELNLNKLCVLGSGLGANVAVCWAAVDWSVPELAQAKQSKDIKGLILSSPTWNASGLALRKPMSHPGLQSKIAMFIVYGEDKNTAKKDVQTITKNIEKFRDPPKRGEFPDFAVFPLPTGLQGTRLITDGRFNMLPDIDRFIKERISEQDFSWSRRRLSN